MNRFSPPPRSASRRPTSGARPINRHQAPRHGVPRSARREPAQRESAWDEGAFHHDGASSSPYMSTHAPHGNESSDEYEAFDPIDYVVADNVLDLREARARRRQEEQRHERRARWSGEAARGVEALRGVEAHRESERRARDNREAQRARMLAKHEEKRRVIEVRQARAEAKLARCPACHWWLLVLTTLLAVLSIPIVYSASMPIALDHHGNADFFFWRQIFFVGVGLAFFVGASRLSAKGMRVAVWSLYAVAVLGLLAIELTPLGTDLGSGTRRWLRLGPLPPQQISELAKVALIGVMADFWSRAAKPVQRSIWPWLACGALTMPIVALVFMQPHLSAASLLFLLPFFIAFHADAPLRHFVKIGVVLLALGVGTVWLCREHRMPGLKTYQQERIAAHFSTKAEDGQGSNYQVLQSQRALQNGGLFGTGLGQSLFKQGHLPAPHTDFILAVVGEEGGLVVALSLLLIYGAIIFFCFHIGHCAGSSFEALLCSGVGTLLAIQVVCNAGVVTGLLPVTGMPLPLLSYGGSGLICVLISIGLVLGVSRRIGCAQEAREAQMRGVETAKGAIKTSGASHSHHAPRQSTSRARRAGVTA